MSSTRNIPTGSRAGPQTPRNAVAGSRSVSGPARISTPSRRHQVLPNNPSDRSAPSSIGQPGPARAKKLSPPGLSRLDAQPYAPQDRMQSAASVLASTSMLTLLSIAKQESLAQARRVAEYEVLGIDGTLAASPPHWSRDWTADSDDEKRLAVGMKWSARKAKDRMRHSARKAREAKAREEAAKREERMIESATGDGVPLAIKVEPRSEAGSSSKARSRRDEVMGIENEETIGSTRRQRDSPANGKGKARRTAVISDSDDDNNEPDAEGDVEMLDADAVKKRIKGTFSNRRSLGKKRRP